MIHIDDGVLRAFLDDELPSSEAAAIRTHVLDCGACRARRDELGRAADVVASALGLLPSGEPAADSWDRVRTSLSTPLPGRGERRGGGFGTRWMARAAGIVLFTAGGAAAALLPGSPLRTWLTDDPVPIETAVTEVAAASTPGIRSAVASERADVALVAPAGVEVAVHRAGDRAGVFGPEEARFRIEGDRLYAESTIGPLRVELPPSVRDAVVTVNGVLRVELRDGVMVTAPESLGDEPDLLVRFRVR
jgi:hypothetical protein